MTLSDVKELSREELQNVILKMQEMLSEEQKQSLLEIMRECKKPDVDETSQPEKARMSQELVEEKMRQIQKWQKDMVCGEKTVSYGRRGEKKVPVMGGKDCMQQS